MQIRAAVGAVFALLALLCANGAAAAAPCATIAAAPEAVLSDLLAEAGRACSSELPALDTQSTTIRLDPEASAPAPRYLTMRMGQFESIEIAVLARDGSIATRASTMRGAIATSSGTTLAFALPQASDAPRTVLVRIDGLAHAASLETLTLAAERPDRHPGHVVSLLMIALLVGMLAMPIVFDALFWRVLRDRFIAWHAAMTACFIMLIGFRSGIVNEVAALDVPAWRIATIMTFGMAIATCLMFTRHFIEEDKLDPRLGRALTWAAPWVLATSALQAWRPEWMLLGDLPVHAMALAPVLVLWLAAIGAALLRGSRAAIFQLVGWIPLTLAFIIQMATELLPGVEAQQALELFYIGMLCEATVTALGVTDRFLSLRRERDSARKMAAELGSLVERDPLTGLINRRGLEDRFVQLQSEGFSTFALLDLDQFKDINDTFGHRIGDEVLCAVAAVLTSEKGRDMIAVRMGGEEFLLLLRGHDQAERAERIRRAISLRVAREVTEIDRMVTASMGVIEAPGELSRSIAFGDLYARADKLLYEAKEAGRNRSMHERLTLFGRDCGDRRGMGAVA